MANDLEDQPEMNDKQWQIVASQLDIDKLKLDLEDAEADQQFNIARSKYLATKKRTAIERVKINLKREDAYLANRKWSQQHFGD